MINQFSNLTYQDYLEHYGVKGMKWGVRKDEAVLRRLTRDMTRVAPEGATRAERKASRKADKKAWKDYKNSTTRKERRQDARVAREQKMMYLIDKATKDPNVLLVTRSSVMESPTLVTGKEFVNHMSRGGAVNISMTELADIRFDVEK